MRPFGVLIVDDDLILNFANCETLKDSGFDVVGVDCAAAALDAVDRATGWSALVTDIDLGIGPDGFEIARRARAANPHLHVVYISGTAEARFRSEGVERSEFLRKPVGPPEIVEALRRLFAVERRLAAGSREPKPQPAPAMAVGFAAADSV
ncbi:response regulator [Phenylobacterium montanum]|uniref:Response regulator n=1 Tax=Phenylobacterium montanum TaxID=2823693 RepID=A0A975G342_9CAUL|nr:response regulator [Caulobacter sp. S6]QUD90253.1 response regulator [Caulobacter sp. S6]